MSNLRLVLLVATAALAACGNQTRAEEPAPPSEAPPEPPPTLALATDEDRLVVPAKEMPVPVPAVVAEEPALAVPPPLPQSMALATPPFRYKLNREAPVSNQGKKPRLKKLVQAANQVTDNEAWFADNQLSLPLFRAPNPRFGEPGSIPAALPTEFEGLKVISAMGHPDHHVALYAKGYSGGRKLLVQALDGQVLAALDFSRWSYGPKNQTADKRFVEQGAVWAEASEGILYVSTGHRTYADRSGGLNAYISAIDMESGELLWQSEPLVANSRNFLLREGWIITGYGFTDEPDFLYVLDMKTGRKVSTTKVKSGPDFILEKDGRLFVRTYNTNYEFKLR